MLFRSQLNHDDDRGTYTVRTLTIRIRWMLENVSTYKKHSTVRAISIGPSEELRRDRMGQTRGDQVEDDPLGLQLRCTGNEQTSN